MEKIAELIALDSEWVALMKQAKAQGVTIEQIRLFLTVAAEARNELIVCLLNIELIA